MEQRRPTRADLVLAGVLTLLGLVTLSSIDELSGVDARVDELAVLLVVVAGVATAVRRVRPVPVLAVVAATTAAYLAIGYPYGPIMFCLALAVYAVGRQVPLVPAAAWSAGALAVVLVHLLTNDAALDGLAGLAPATAWVAIPLTIGAARRLVVAAGTRERAAADRRLVDAERLRLAQEVHDVVGHGLAAIQMQADIALHLSDRRPDQAVVALQAISRASDEALTELRSTLASVAPDDEADTRAPTPGLARLDALRDRVQSAGVAVELSVSGTPRPVSAAVDLAAYRILQEALTNVVEHSSHPHAEVAVRHGGDAIELTVTDQHLDVGPRADGFGLTGMRRRVAHLGGPLDAGPAARRHVRGARHPAHGEPVREPAEESDDLGAAGRRPGPGADRPARPARERGRLHRRRRGRRRARGGRRRPAGPDPTSS